MNTVHLVAICLKAATFTVGGAAGLFPVLAHELVHQGGWLTQEEFLYGLALSEATPGPAVIGMAIAGVKQAGLWGGLLVTLALVLPGLCWMELVLQARQRFRNLPSLERFLAGVRPAVPGLLVWLAYRLIPAGSLAGFSILLTGLTLWLILRWRIEPALLIVSALLAGWLAR